MRISRSQLALLCIAFAGIGLNAQTNDQSPAAQPSAQHNTSVRTLHFIPHPFPAHKNDQNQKLVFPSGSETSGRRNALEYRTESEMTPADRDLVLNAEGTIAERAHFDDLDFDAAPGNPWLMQQAVCPVLPNHLIVQFTRNRGQGDLSVFTAILPRYPGSRIRIIPVQKRGYSLFSPAPVNAVTLSVFNRIFTEEKSAAPPDWLTLGLCYAAMAGTRPKAELSAADPRAEQFPLARPATLLMEKDGAEKIIFVDRSALPAPMEWTMIFNRQGKLVKAVHHKAMLMTPLKQTQQITDLK